MLDSRRRAADTRKVYAFEDQLPRRPAGIRSLRRLARRIWRAYHRRGNRCPAVIAGRGIPSNGTLASYCLGYTEIVLARQHRNRMVLIHEMTHALGPRTHGIRFQNLYAELLDRYL